MKFLSTNPEDIINDLHIEPEIVHKYMRKEKIKNTYYQINSLVWLVVTIILLFYNIFLAIIWCIACVWWLGSKIQKFDADAKLGFGNNTYRMYKDEVLKREQFNRNLEHPTAEVLEKLQKAHKKSKKEIKDYEVVVKFLELVNKEESMTGYDCREIIRATDRLIDLYNSDKENPHYKYNIEHYIEEYQKNIIEKYFKDKQQVTPSMQDMMKDLFGGSEITKAKYESSINAVLNSDAYTSEEKQVRVNVLNEALMKQLDEGKQKEKEKIEEQFWEDISNLKHYH